MTPSGRPRLIERRALFSPRPTGHCHASTLAERNDGTRVFAWFSGSREGATDTVIQGIFLFPDGSSIPFTLPRPVDEPHWNPVLFDPGTGNLLLFFKTGPTPTHWRSWVVELIAPPEFSAPRELAPGDVQGRGPVKNKPLALHSGAWLAPGSWETQENWRAYVDRSLDGRHTWCTTPIPFDPADFTNPGARGVIQPALWESTPERVHMLLRSTATRIFRSDSSDGGQTWTPAHPTPLPNNNSGLDVARRQDGCLALICNPVSGYWAARTPLTLFQSSGEGFDWSRVLDLETDPGEYSYPSALFARNGDLWISYTWRRQSILFCRVAIS